MVWHTGVRVWAWQGDGPTRPRALRTMGWEADGERWQGLAAGQVWRGEGGDWVVVEGRDPAIVQAYLGCVWLLHLNPFSFLFVLCRWGRHVGVSCDQIGMDSASWWIFTNFSCFSIPKCLFYDYFPFSYRFKRLLFSVDYLFSFLTG